MGGCFPPYRFRGHWNLIELAAPRSKFVVEELGQEQDLDILLNVAFQDRSVNRELGNAIPLTDLGDAFGAEALWPAPD